MPLFLSHCDITSAPEHSVSIKQCILLTKSCFGGKPAEGIIIMITASLVIGQLMSRQKVGQSQNGAVHHICRDDLYDHIKKICVYFLQKLRFERKKKS